MELRIITARAMKNPENIFTTLTCKDESEKRDMDANVLEYEPHIALFVPDDNPLIFYKRIADISISALHEGGKLYLEINPRHSAELSEMLLKKGFDNVKVIKDIHQRNRFISCCKTKKF